MTVIIAYIRLHTTKHPAIYAEIYKYHRSCVCCRVVRYQHKNGHNMFDACIGYLIIGAIIHYFYEGFGGHAFLVEVYNVYKLYAQ